MVARRRGANTLTTIRPKFVVRSILIQKETGQDLGVQGLDLVVRHSLMDAFREA